MKIGFIGSGNVATVLASLMRQKGHQVVQVLGRSQEKAALLASQWNCEFGLLGTSPHEEADIFIAALSDDALLKENFHPSFQGKILIHTAGSVPMNRLLHVTNRVGVLYPLQSLRKELTYIPPIPFLIDAADENLLQVLRHFAETLSEQVEQANDEQRFRLHAAAVIVNNFTNHLYALAEDFCTKEKVDFQLLFPLIMETAGRIRHLPPRQLQTGPAIRDDRKTISAHLELIKSFKQLSNLYEDFTESIRKGIQ